MSRSQILKGIRVKITVVPNFFVASSFQTNDQSELSKVLAHDAKLVLSFISEPKRSIKITGHFTCATAYVIYCITCTYCNKLYIGETGRRLGDRFREHLRDLERNDKDASQQVAGHFNVPNHSKQHMAVCGLSLHLGNSESCKTNLSSKSALLILWYQRALFIQLIHSSFLVSVSPPIA